MKQIDVPPAPSGSGDPPGAGYGPSDSARKTPLWPLTGRPGRPTDMPFLIRLDELPGVAEGLPPWPKDRHWRAMSDPDHQYILFQDGDDRGMGYVVLGGLTNPDGCLEIVRVVAALPGQGIGSAMVRAVLAHAFEALKAHRVWLSLYSDNAYARRMLLTVGFVLEGKLREATRGPHGYRSLSLMGMLRREYESSLG